jgi:hypothetical protein
MATTAKQLNLVCMKADSTSDGMLLGSYEQIDGEEEPLHIPGLLDPSKQPQVNIFMQNEATLLLDAKRTDWSKDFMTYYQVAMNPIGTPDNLLEKTNLAMRGDMIAINPVVSFYLTTYPPDRLLETITKAGFIQRMTTLYNIHKFDERVEQWKTMATKTGQKREGDDEVPKIVSALKFINSHYQKNNFISVAEETRGTFNSVMKELYMPLLKVNKAMREHLGDFIPRTYENVVKCAYQHAMLRLSPLVENVDIVYSMSVLQPAWQRMITYMEESDEVIQPLLSKWNKWRRDAQEVYEHILVLQKQRGKYQDGWIKKETMIKYLSSSDMGWDKSPSTTRSRLDKMTIDLKFFEESKIDNVKCIRLKTKSR